MLLREPPPYPEEERDRSGVTARFLAFVETEMLKIPGVRGVRWNIIGWQRTALAWVRRGIR